MLMGHLEYRYLQFSAQSAMKTQFCGYESWSQLQNSAQGAEISHTAPHGMTCVYRAQVCDKLLQVTDSNTKLLNWPVVLRKYQVPIQQIKSPVFIRRNTESEKEFTQLQLFFAAYYYQLLHIYQHL